MTRSFMVDGNLLLSIRYKSTALAINSIPSFGIFSLNFSLLIFSFVIQSSLSLLVAPKECATHNAFLFSSLPPDCHSLFFLLFINISFLFGGAFNFHFRRKDTRRGKDQNMTVEFEKYSVQQMKLMARNSWEIYLCYTLSILIQK